VDGGSRRDRPFSRESRRDDPWARSGIWIASLDYLKQVHVIAASTTAVDLVVVDEAPRHAAARSPRGLSRHRPTNAADSLILTATPHDGDAARFDRLINLGRLRSIDDPLTVLRRTRSDLDWQERGVSLPSRRAVDRREAVAAGARRLRTSRARGGRRRSTRASLLLLSVLRKRAVDRSGAGQNDRATSRLAEGSLDNAQPEWHHSARLRRRR
jgi:hypothetical protein